MKFGIYITSNMENSIVLFTFFVLGRKHSFLANLVQKIKLVRLSWNSVPRLIRICEFNGDAHFFVLDQIDTFVANLVQKSVSLSWNLIPRLILLCRIQWWNSPLLFYTRSTRYKTVKMNKTFTVLINEGKRSMIIVSVTSWGKRLWNRELLSTHFFFFFCCGGHVHGFFGGSSLKSFE